MKEVKLFVGDEQIENIFTENVNDFMCCQAFNHLKDDDSVEMFGHILQDAFGDWRPKIEFEKEDEIKSIPDGILLLTFDEKLKIEALSKQLDKIRQIMKDSFVENARKVHGDKYDYSLVKFFTKEGDDECDCDCEEDCEEDFDYYNGEDDEFECDGKCEGFRYEDE
jgi:hypothetical protein